MAIELLRGILIVWIVMFHYTVRYSQIYPVLEQFPLVFENGGRVGVTFFFIISGFYLCKRIVRSPQTSIKGISIFCLNKYWRLYPSYFVSVVIIYAIVCIFGLPDREIPPPQFLVNLLFICHPSIDYVDGAHWFIADLVKIYILLSPFLLFKPQFRDKAIIILEIMLVILCFGNYYMNIPIIDKLNVIVSAESCLKVLLGYNLFVSVENKKGIICYLNRAIALIIIGWYCYTINVLWIMVYAVITYMAFKYEKLYIPTYIKPLTIIGTYSFEWYLIHQNIGFVIINLLQDKGMTTELWLLFPIALTFIMAVIIHKLMVRLPYKLI